MLTASPEQPYLDAVAGVAAALATLMQPAPLHPAELKLSSLHRVIDRGLTEGDTLCLIHRIETTLPRQESANASSPLPVWRSELTSRKSSVSTKTEGISDPFAPLTWEDLTVWAGPKIVSRGQGYRRRVQELASTTDGALVAWVLGSDQYATRVAIKRKKLTSDCTCPYGATCKHAVAVVLEYLECLKQQRPVPRAGKDDPRLQELAAMDEPDDWDYEEEEDDDELADIGPHGRPPQRPLAPAPQAQRRNRLRSGARMRGDTFFDSLK